MKKIATLALISVISLSTPAFAQSQNDQDIKSDVGAINKDNAALQKDQNALAANRAAKAADKANGSYGKQAVDSVKIGADQTAIAEKNAETGADKKDSEAPQKGCQHR
jgi:hypothetical protein